ncbi:MAG: PDZ domain-containing protein [Burkholderia sp.]|jgi:hypothetical protein|uniref:PDZ domain-containing protein n=1 Tax=Burkholderia sp. TaxID=36773 RepID=UPI0028369E23|nr:PDZ domain-containing protein [Burkholderia sp.]MDR0242767.1 PDZ domain-containing protein [Burkholderia sp.]
MKRGFLFAVVLATSLFAANAALSQEKAGPPLYTWLSARFPDSARYDSPVLTVGDSGLPSDQGIVQAQLTLIQSPQGDDSALGLAVAFYTTKQWNFNTVRDNGTFGTRYKQGNVAVVIPTLNGNGYGDTDSWRPLAADGKTWPVKGGVFVMLDRIYLKAYEISGNDFVLSLSDYNAVGKVFSIRIPAAYLSRFLAGIPNDRGLVPQGLSSHPTPFGVEYAALNEQAVTEMKIPDGAMRVMGIVPGAIADRAGLKNYDVLLRFGDHPLKEPNDLVNAVHATPPGTAVPLTVWRNAREVRLQARF